MDISFEYALARDADDPLGRFRDEFFVPQHDGRDQVYLVGNSLGLQPKRTAARIEQEMCRWRELGVAGHFKGQPAWIDAHTEQRTTMAELVGALPHEVTLMNTLTVNLHHLLVSFYRPRPDRYKIIIEKHAFPSDRYAVVSHLRLHGFDPDDALIELEDEGKLGRLSPATFEAYLAEHGDQVALVLLPGIQYVSGAVLDVDVMTELAHRAGAVVGQDHAHAVGNVPLNLHDGGCDFAVWCTYKYLNGGPGSIGGAFVHERHHNANLPRLHGWFGNDLATRFQMAHDFRPEAGTDAWIMSNPSILSLVTVNASLSLFAEARFSALREKSIALTGYLAALIESQIGEHIEILTPLEPEQRGCQLSLRVRAGRSTGRQLFTALEAQGIVGDWREPDVIRMAPTPLYNRYADAWQLVNAIKDYLGP